MIETPTERARPQDQARPTENPRDAPGAPAFGPRNDQQSSLSPLPLAYPLYPSPLPSDDEEMLGDNEAELVEEPADDEE